MIRNSNCATKIAESQRTWKQNHLFLLKREPRNLRVLNTRHKICEICEICELFKTRRNLRNLRNLRVLKLLAKSAESAKSASPSKLAKIRERKAQDGNNLRRNWFIGGCPINWRRPTLPHSHAVPSARTGLTALFGMGRGVPRGYNRHCLLKFLAYSTHINAL